MIKCLKTCVVISEELFSNSMAAFFRLLFCSLLLSFMFGCDSQTCGSTGSSGQPMLQLSKKPRIYMADNIFTAEECQRLIKVAQPQMTISNVIGSDGKRKDSKSRKAKQTGLLDNMGDGIVKIFRERMANMALMPVESAEPLSVIRYDASDHYGLHFDSSLTVGRLATVMVYLNDVDEGHGGHTVFPWAQRTEAAMHHPDVLGTGRDIDELRAINVEPPIAGVCKEDSDSLLIKPQTGRVVVWFNHQPDLKRESYAAMHGGCPVSGKKPKWIATLWIKWFEEERNDMKTLLSATGLQKWQIGLYDN